MLYLTSKIPCDINNATFPLFVLQRYFTYTLLVVYILQMVEKLYFCQVCLYARSLK